MAATITATRCKRAYLICGLFGERNITRTEQLEEWGRAEAGSQSAIVNRRSAILVHPPAAVFLLALLFASRWDVIAVLIELHVAVVVAHVDLELARRALPLPAVISVLRAREQAFARRLAADIGVAVVAVGKAAARVCTRRAPPLEEKLDVEE